MIEDNLNSKNLESQNKLDEKSKQFKELQEKFEKSEKDFKELVIKILFKLSLFI